MKPNSSIFEEKFGNAISSPRLTLFIISKFSAPNIAFVAFWLAKNSDYEPIVGVLRHMENSAPSLKIFAL